MKGMGRHSRLQTTSRRTAVNVHNHAKVAGRLLSQTWDLFILGGDF